MIIGTRLVGLSIKDTGDCTFFYIHFGQRNVFLYLFEPAKQAVSLFLIAERLALNNATVAVRRLVKRR